jgi:hypothetical protein
MHEVGLRMTQQESPFCGFYMTSHINKKYGYEGNLVQDCVERASASP